jgi:hypothetical protein
MTRKTKRKTETIKLKEMCSKTVFLIFLSAAYLYRGRERQMIILVNPVKVDSTAVTSQIFVHLLSAEMPTSTMAAVHAAFVAPTVQAANWRDPHIGDRVQSQADSCGILSIAADFAQSPLLSCGPSASEPQYLSPLSTGAKAVDHFVPKFEGSQFVPSS